MEEKPTLMQLRRKLNLEAYRVAEEAMLPLRIEYQMEIGVAVTREYAVRIMAALSRLAKQQFTIDDVVYVEKEGDNGSNRRGNHHGNSRVGSTLSNGQKDFGGTSVHDPGSFRRTH